MATKPGWWAAIGVGLLVVIGVMWRWCSLQPPAVACPDDPITNETRIAAMLSVHAHAYWPDRQFPRGVSVWPLEQAVACLDVDSDAFAISRRRRAVARLGAFGLAKPDFQAAIRNLGVQPPELEKVFADAERNGELKEKERSLKREPKTTSWLFSLAFAAPPNFPPTPETIAKEKIAGNYLVNKMSVPGCAPTEHLTMVDVGGPDTILAVEMFVNRDVRSVARCIDPQSWDQSSKFFMPPQRTYLLKNKSDHESIDLSVPPGSKYGSEYRPRYLFEFFSCPACGSAFKNILKVWTDRSGVVVAPIEQTYHYDLEAVVSSESGATIQTDWGYLKARRDPNGKTFVQTSKTIGFVQAYANGAAAGGMMVGLQQSEVAAELAEMVCCLVK